MVLLLDDVKVSAYGSTPVKPELAKLASWVCAVNDK
jgi:hypothetical protein